MKIGLGYPYNADLDFIKNSGFECLDLSLADTNDPYYTSTEEELKAMMQKEAARTKEAGFEIFQVHGPWPVDDTTEEGRAKNLQDMKTCIRATAALGCKYMVVHPLMPYSWGTEDDPAFAREVNVKHYKALSLYAEEYGVVVCLENMPVNHHSLASVASIVEFVKMIDSPALGICLDTGHAAITHEAAGAAVRLCGDLLKVLHIHDNDGQRDSHTPPFFLSGVYNTTDWEDFKKALHDIDYHGVVSLECYPHYLAPAPIRRTLLLAMRDAALYFAD